jgi:transcriptional regulator with XRE-family HTH domain
MPRTPGPTIRRFQLGLDLRELREAARVTIRTAAAEIEVQPGTLSKIEGGKQAIKASHIKLLTPLYGVSADERARLLELASEANVSGWWVAYSRHVPAWFKLFLGYESESSSLHSYESELIPGLLQTPGYARAVALAVRPDSSESELDRQVELRRERQQRLAGEDPPAFHAVLNEACLHRLVGGRAVMREQLEHLQRLAELDHVTIQVLPFSAGAHPAMTAPFLLMGFDVEPRMNTVYLENGRGSVYLEGETDLTRYAAIFEQLTQQAANQRAAIDLIATVGSNL